MTLPEIVLPKITLPFDIAVLLHPSVVHFLIAIPVVILLLELMNLMMKKKAVGGVSFFLLLLVAVAAVGAYFTGLVDGKEAYPALAEAAKSELAEHKLLGTYLMLASFVLVFLKLLAMTGNKILKALYIFALIGFVVVMFNQGKEGGELVYEHGLNVQAVQELDDKIFDLEESLEELESASSPEKVETENDVTATQAPKEETVVSPKTHTTSSEVKEEVHTSVEGTSTETLVTPVQSEEAVSSPASLTSEIQTKSVSTQERVPTPQ